MIKLKWRLNCLNTWKYETDKDSLFGTSTVILSVQVQSGNCDSKSKLCHHHKTWTIAALNQKLFKRTAPPQTPPRSDENLESWTWIYLLNLENKFFLFSLSLVKCSTTGQMHDDDEKWKPDEVWLFRFGQSTTKNEPRETVKVDTETQWCHNQRSPDSTRFKI